MQQIYRGTPMPKCDFNKVAKQLYWNRTSAWVLSCKFAAHFQNTFFQEHLRVAASVLISAVKNKWDNANGLIADKWSLFSSVIQSRISKDLGLSKGWKRYIKKIDYFLGGHGNLMDIFSSFI